MPVTKTLPSHSELPHLTLLGTLIWGLRLSLFCIFQHADQLCDVRIVHVRQGSVVKKSPSPLQPSHRVTLSEAKGLSRSAERSFASLRMTGLTLSVGEELSRSFEPCLKTINMNVQVSHHEINIEHPVNSLRVIHAKGQINNPSIS